MAEAAITHNHFVVGEDDFAKLSVRHPNDDPHSKFCFFYHETENRLIKHFLLRRGERVETLCQVKLIDSARGLEPRVRLWKRNKERPHGPNGQTEEVSAPTELRNVRAAVDVHDCHDEFWLLVDFLRTYDGIALPPHDFRVIAAQDLDLLDVLEDHDRSEVVAAVGTYLKGHVSERDIQMLVDRRDTVRRFEQLLEDPDYFDAERRRLVKTSDEGVWQSFFEENQWILGYGLTLVACDAMVEERLEQITTGADLFSGAGKRVDAAMRTRGLVNSLLFTEIKHQNTPLLAKAAYRPPDVYRPSSEMGGAVAQVQKTVHKAVRGLADLHAVHDSTGEFRLEVATIMPRQVVVIGHLRQLLGDDESRVNQERLSSFDLYRRSQLGVDILTFDELLERARFIASD